MNKVAELENIIDGLQYVLEEAGLDKHDYELLDYASICMRDAVKAAIAMLEKQKPQETRLLTADEVQHLRDRETICVEQLISRETDERGYITGCGWGVMCNKDNSPGNGLLVSMLGTFFPNTITKIPYEAMYSREDGSGRYTVQFRFWTDRPTNEESKAVRWK